MAHVKGSAVRRAALQKHAGDQPAQAVEGQHVKVFERTAEEQRFEIFAGLDERVQARRAAEGLQARIARDGGHEAEQQRVGLVHVHVFQHVRVGFEHRGGGDEAPPKPPDPFAACVGVQGVEQFPRGGVDAADAVPGGAHSLSGSAPASSSARRTTFSSATGSLM